MNKSLVLSALSFALMVGSAYADTSGKRIAFSNNYAGNSWRQAMLDSYSAVTQKAVADGVVAAADVFTTADQESRRRLRRFRTSSCRAMTRSSSMRARPLR